MNPNAILGKYLIKQIVINFLAVLLMVMGIVLMFEVIELLRRTSDRTDVDAWFIMQMAVTKLPRTLEMVFPFVMMIAAMITFWRLSKSNEFVIIRAAGVSIWGFLTPVLFAVFTVGVLNITSSIRFRRRCTRLMKRWITVLRPRIRKPCCFRTRDCG